MMKDIYNMTVSLNTAKIMLIRAVRLHQNLESESMNAMKATYEKVGG